jgi:hypothetical protein
VASPSAPTTRIQRDWDVFAKAVGLFAALPIKGNRSSIGEGPLPAQTSRVFPRPFVAPPLPLPPATAKVFGQLVVALEQISEGGHTPLPFCDSGIVNAGTGSSTETEEPMYKWVASKPEPHRSKFRVAVMTLD